MDMIERVARAIVEATAGPWELMSPQGRDAARQEARAALAALIPADAGSGEPK